MVRRIHTLVLGLVLTAAPLAGQGVLAGAGVGIVRPHGISVSPSAGAWIRFGVSGTVSVQADLSGWTVTATDTVLVHTGVDSLGNDVFAEQALDVRVSDVSLGLTPAVRVRVSDRWHVLVGAGPRLHYLVSDLQRLHIEGDSEVRVGLHLLGGLEATLGQRIGVYVWPRFDVVKDVSHWAVVAGILFAL